MKFINIKKEVPPFNKEVMVLLKLKDSENKMENPSHQFLITYLESVKETEKGKSFFFCNSFENINRYNIVGWRYTQNDELSLFEEENNYTLKQSDIDWLLSTKSTKNKNSFDLTFYHVDEKLPVEAESEQHTHQLLVTQKGFGGKYLAFYKDGKFMKSYTTQHLNVETWAELPSNEEIHVCVSSSQKKNDLQDGVNDFSLKCVEESSPLLGLGDVKDFAKKLMEDEKENAAKSKQLDSEFIEHIKSYTHANSQGILNHKAKIYRLKAVQNGTMVKNFVVVYDDLTSNQLLKLAEACYGEYFDPRHTIAIDTYEMMSTMEVLKVVSNTPKRDFFSINPHGVVTRQPLREYSDNYKTNKNES